MQSLTIEIEKTDGFLRSIGLTILGCCLIALCSQVKIPTQPVPFTLQTLAISLLALTQSPRQAFASVLLYLACGSAGLPVFAGKANVLWILGKCGGYLVGFPLAAFLTSSIARTRSPYLAVVMGQFVIYTLGFVWLIAYCGPITALCKGVLIFIPSDFLKNLLAIALARYARKWSSHENLHAS